MRFRQLVQGLTLFAGNICIDRSDGLKKSFDYPSGHFEGLALAELAPDPGPLRRLQSGRV